MKRVALGLLLLAAWSGSNAKGDDKDSKDPTFHVDGITIVIDRKLQGGWEFSSFKTTKARSVLQVEGVALNRGSGPMLHRWYGYDRDGVKIEEGPLGYQDYLPGEKTKIEMALGENWQQIKRIKIASR